MERETLRLSPRLMPLWSTLAMDILMPTPVSPSAPALAWTPSPRVLTLPLRDMSHTTDTDTTLTVITTERGKSHVLITLTFRNSNMYPFVLLNIPRSADAEAEAEADPAVLYASYGYPYGK